MTNAVPRVSVLLPAYNTGATLAQAIASIQAQSLRDWELLAVNDGSSDATGEILDAAAAADSRIRVRHQVHGGVVPAANAALAEARGAYIARMDADDEAHPERLARQISTLENDHTLDLVGCQVAFGGDPTAARGFSLHIDWCNSVLTPEDHALAQFLEYPLANPTLCGRRDAWIAVGPTRDGNFPEDYEWFLRAMQRGLRIAKVPEPLLTWNDPPTRLTRTDGRYAVDAFFRVKIPFLTHWLEQNVEAERPILIWGAGRTTRQRLRPLFDRANSIAGWIDIDPKKIDGSAQGLPVLGPEILARPPRPFILPAVRSRGAREQILERLHALGFVPQQDYLPLA